MYEFYKKANGGGLCCDVLLPKEENEPLINTD
jgi:hypothetical protein